MNKYIAIALGGATRDVRNQEFDRKQVIGMFEAESPGDAYKMLLSKNTVIYEDELTYKKVQIFQVGGCDSFSDIICGREAVNHVVTIRMDDEYKDISLPSSDLKESRELNLFLRSLYEYNEHFDREEEMYRVVFDFSGMLALKVVILVYMLELFLCKINFAPTLYEYLCPQLNKEYLNQIYEDCKIS